MPQKVLHQIKYLCKEIAAVEWSGVLFYNVDGSIKDPENLTLTLEDILPMHKGTTGYTEYTFDERVINHMMDTPESDEWKMGHIHSHNNMNVYFSGTDWSELEDNSPNHNFYLSLIVNNKMEFCAKVAFIIETDSEEASFVAKDENGAKYSFSKESLKQKKLVTYDCEIICPDNTLNVGDSFKKKVTGIIEDARKKAVASRTATKTVYTGFGKSKVVPVNTREPQNRWDDWNNNLFDSRTNQHIAESTITHEEEEELKELVFEDFALYVINTGNDTSQYKNISDVLEYYKAFNLTAKQLASKILKEYSNLYQNFFFNVKDKDTSDMFEEMTEGIIEIMDTERYQSNSLYHREMLKSVVDVLKNMLEKFKKYEPNTVK